MSAGSAVTRFVGNVTGITAAMEIFKRFIVSGGEANFKYIASLDKIGKTFSAVAATGIAAMIAGMILLGLEYKKIIQAEAELTNALATSGGALGISKTEAVAAAEGMASFGIGTLKAGAAITEIAKAGNIGKESIDLITKSAVDLEKTTGISIEETIKQFAKLQEEPAKALTEIAQKTGLVDKATLDYVYSLEQQGDKTKAARIATIAFASVNAQVASEVRDNWSPIEVLWNDIKSAIGSVKQEIYDLTTSNAVVGALRTVWETVAVVISEVWFTIKGVGKEIGGIGAQIAAVMQGDFSGAAEIGRMMKADAASAAEEQKKYVDAILNRTSVEQKSFNQSKGQNSQYAKWRKENDQALDKSISKTDKYKAKELEMQKAVLAGTVSQIEADKALAGWKKIILGEEKTKKDPSENYYATLMREATAASIKADDATKSLTASQVELIETVNDPRFLKLSKVKQEIYLSTMAANVATEQQTALTEKLAEAEEHRLKLLGKSEGIGKQYYSDMQKLEEFAKVAGWSREEIEELTRAVFMATPAWQKYQKATEAVAKSNIETKLQLANIQAQNMELDHNLAMVGLSALAFIRSRCLVNSVVKRF
jgi:phage-related minor tail protein